MRSSPLLLAAALVLSGEPSASAPFTVVTISDAPAGSVAVVDIDRDGRLDIVSGNVWYHAPHWTPYRFRGLPVEDGRVDSHSLLPLDVDEDGWVDLIDLARSGRRITWWRNPGRAWGPSQWVDRTIHACCPVELAVLADIDGDGHARELVVHEPSQGLAWYKVRKGFWTRHSISTRDVGSGLGVGDLNGDGRIDVLTAVGWFEAPVDPRSSEWPLQEAWGAAVGPVDMVRHTAGDDLRLGLLHLTDIDGNGLPDVLAGGTGRGAVWFEQRHDGWIRHRLAGGDPPARGSLVADLDGDGHPELVAVSTAADGRSRLQGQPAARVVSYRRNAGAEADGAGERPAWDSRVLAAIDHLSPAPELIAVDLDDDGDVDLVGAGPSGVFWLRNDSAGNPDTGGPMMAPYH